MRKVLFISDNLDLLVFTNQLCIDLNAKDKPFEYFFAISPYSDSKIFISSGLFVEKLDLRIPSIINDIIENYDLVISLHCKQLFPKELVENVRCVNVHPGYNPTNRGWYPQVFAIINNSHCGATIHEIDTQLDHGPVIRREKVEITSFDNSLSVYQKVLEIEKKLLSESLYEIIRNEYDVTPMESEGNLYLKDDFNRLCHIDLNETFRACDLINRLRALSHGNYKNAYFIDEKTGCKIYLSLTLIPE